jgi:hypothetical protein
MIRVCVALLIALLALGQDAFGETIPSNDKCEDAIPLTFSSSSSSTLIVDSTTTTVNATLDDMSYCGENFVNSPGVWYSVDNNQLLEDQVLTVSTCRNETNFNTAITIYTGDSCDSLLCWSGMDDDDECQADGQTTLSLQVTSGLKYYILIHGSQPNDIGDFGLQLTVSQSLEGDTSTQKPNSQAIVMASSTMLLLISSILAIRFH